MTGILVRADRERCVRPHTEGGRPREDGGGGRRDASTSRGWPVTPRGWEEAGRTLLDLRSQPRPACTWIPDLWSRDLGENKCLPFQATRRGDLFPRQQEADTGGASHDELEQVVEPSTGRAENWGRETKSEHGHFLSQEPGAEGRGRQPSGPSFRRGFLKKSSFVSFHIFLFGLLSYCPCLWKSHTARAGSLSCGPAASGRPALLCHHCL